MRKKKEKKKKEKCIPMYALFIPPKWCRKVFIRSINPILIIFKKLESLLNG